MTQGTLFAIGTGPGASDLLTLRAARVLQNVDAILAAASSKNEFSSSLDIARPWLKTDIPVIRLDFPMTREKRVLRQAWDAAARTTLETLNQGRDAAFLTLGDPLVYSTFAYLMRAIRKFDPGVKIEIVPGITSFQAAAARDEFVLCEGSQCLNIISGIISLEDMENILQKNEPAVIMKAYRNYEAIAAALAATDRLKNARIFSFVGQKNESAAPAGEMNQPPYMSLILSPAPDSGK